MLAFSASVAVAGAVAAAKVCRSQCLSSWLAAAYRDVLYSAPQAPVALSRRHTIHLGPFQDPLLPFDRYRGRDRNISGGVPGFRREYVRTSGDLLRVECKGIGCG